MDISIGNELIVNSAKMENAKNAVQNADKAKSSHELEKASQDFEAIFVNMVLQAMWKTIPDSGLFEKNNTKYIYEGIIQSALSEDIARQGGFGIGKMLYEQVDKK